MGFWRSFFAKPARAAGTPLSVYMLAPRAVGRHVRTLVTDPAYFVSRVRVMWYQALHPDAPWLTEAAIRMLESKLAPEMTAFEWGSGRSTVYLAQRVTRVVSVEHDPQWFDAISAQLRQRELGNVEYHLIDLSAGATAYCDVIKKSQRNLFDIVLVDGQFRDECVAAAVDWLRPGGWLVVDNAEEIRDVGPCAEWPRIETTNGVWCTTIFVKEPSRLAL
jgi:protein-L-isoaspartate O-methyltransferase